MLYNTKQRNLLLQFFNNNHDIAFSAVDIANNLKGMDISFSAVYRNLSALEKEGKIRKINKKGTRKAYYQYVDCKECKGHLHITCTRCGKTDHLADNDSVVIEESILKNAKFYIDKTNTVLYGICEKCNN